PVEKADDQLARLHVPQPHRLIGRAGDQKAAVGRYRERPHLSFVTYEGAAQATSEVISLDFRNSADDHRLAVGRECKRCVGGDIGVTKLDFRLHVVAVRYLQEMRVYKKLVVFHASEIDRQRSVLADGAKKIIVAWRYASVAADLLDDTQRSRIRWQV